MNKLIVKGKNKLYGKVEVKSAKNALLPLIASCVLLDFEVGFLNVPRLKDVDVLLEIIKSMGGKYRYDDDVLYVDCSTLYNPEIPCEEARKIRASIFLLGSLISRFHKVSTVRPGGCNFGERPIDMHINGLEKLGCRFDSSNQKLEAKVQRFIGAEIVLPFPSVGATENIILAAVKAKGITKIY